MEIEPEKKFLDLINQSEHRQTLLTIVDQLYEKTFIHNYDTVIKEILNRLLALIDYKPISDLKQFKVVFSDLTKINIKQFISDNKSLIGKIDSSLINFDLACKKKLYKETSIIYFMNAFLKLIDYKVDKYCSTVTHNKISKNTLKCRLLKI